MRSFERAPLPVMLRLQRLAYVSDSLSLGLRGNPESARRDFYLGLDVFLWLRADVHG